MESIYANLELPSMPQVITRILEIDENDIQIGVNQLESLISSDPNLVSKVLKLANSPFYSRSNNISDLNRALSLLGFKSIKSLTLLVSIAKLIPTLSQNTGIQKSLWMNSIMTAVTAKTLANRLNQKPLQEKAFLGGLLRHIGQLILYSRFPSSYESALKQSSNGLDPENLQKYELHLFGATTFSLTEFAMHKWNFPQEFVAVAETESYEPQEVENKSGLLGSIICFAEIIVSFNRARSENSDEKILSHYSELIKKYVEHFSLSQQEADFIKNKISESFKENDFYAFCEELFAI